MRRLVAFIIIHVILFAFIGCSKNESIINDNSSNIEERVDTKQTPVNNEEVNTYEEKTTEDSKQLEQVKEEAELKDSEKINSETKVTEDSFKIEDQNIEVIAKSNSMVTSKEKEEILNEIDRLLDDVLTNINDMDSIEDQDLVLEN